MIIPSPSLRVRKVLSKVSIAALFCFLSACAPSPTLTAIVISDAFIQTAIAQTEIAVPTKMPSPIPSETATITPTSTTSTATATRTPIPSLTPILSPTSDLRVMITDPQEFLPKIEDLPAGVEWFIPFYPPISDGLARYTNQDIITQLGDSNGKAFLEATGRLDGWRIAYQHKDIVPNLPEEIICEIAIYRTPKGAQAAVLGTTLIGWKIVEDELVLGDVHRIYKNSAMYNDGQGHTKPMLWYALSFSYRNYSVLIKMWGWAQDLNLSHAEELARKLLARMEAALTFDPEMILTTYPLQTPKP